MRARVLIFIATLLVLGVAPLAPYLRLALGCVVYLIVVLPAIDR
jgi:hypothetical protein